MQEGEPEGVGERGGGGGGGGGGWRVHKQTLVNVRTSNKGRFKEYSGRGGGVEEEQGCWEQQCHFKNYIDFP